MDSHTIIVWDSYRIQSNYSVVTMFLQNDGSPIGLECNCRLNYRWGGQGEVISVALRPTGVVLVVHIVLHTSMPAKVVTRTPASP